MITHRTAIRTLLADYINDLVNTGTGANGKLQILTALNTVLVSYDLEDPAFIDAVNGVIVLDGTPLEEAAIATGTATKFNVLDKNLNIVFSGTVTNTTGTGDIKLNSTYLVAGNDIIISSFSYSAPA